MFSLNTHFHFIIPLPNHFYVSVSAQSLKYMPPNSIFCKDRFLSKCSAHPSLCVFFCFNICFATNHQRFNTFQHRHWWWHTASSPKTSQKCKIMDTGELNELSAQSVKPCNNFLANLSYLNLKMDVLTRPEAWMTSQILGLIKGLLSILFQDINIWVIWLNISP